ncbi:hypothetical protein ANO11243_067230 [Dothideomycetidae sp. 11243]|nr:hypothetical protein ANO11243_067230 [fungal sp. No.11243]
MAAQPRYYPVPRHPGLHFDYNPAYQVVAVHHPAYTAPNTLIELPAIDKDGAGRHGIDYDLIHTACSIISCNRFDGWFEPVDDRTHRVTADKEGTSILLAGAYYFVLPDSVGTA